jgi:hypothetical protein
MTVYIDGHAEGSIAPLTEWRGAVPVDETLERFMPLASAVTPGGLADRSIRQILSSE